MAKHGRMMSGGDLEAGVERTKALDMALSQIEKQFGTGAVMKMGDKGSLSIETVPTGALALDLALGIGGIPRGRVIEIFGPEGSGKTTLATHVVAEAQRNGGICAYIDAEHAMDPIYARAIGVDVEHQISHRIGRCPLKRLRRCGTAGGGVHSGGVDGKVFDLRIRDQQQAAQPAGLQRCGGFAQDRQFRRQIGAVERHFTNKLPAA
jgi:RecA/RadA recombinase